MNSDKAVNSQASGVDTPKASKTLSLRMFFIMLVVILAFTFLRAIHLDADTPEGVSNNVGIYVDEGYKTLAPRNLVLFGKVNWHSDDEYPGWLKSSSLTNWPYYILFKSFGANIQTARSVTIGYFFLILIGYLIVMAGRYRKALLLLGVAALSIQSTLFFFSRVALIEVAIAAVVYGCLFILLKLEDRPMILSIAVLIGAMALGIFGLKASALLYFTPICLAFAIVLISGAKFKMPRWAVWLCVIGFSALVLTLALSTQHIWQKRIAESAFGVWRRALVTPLAEAAPFAVVLGLLCAGLALLFHPKAACDSLYRCSLLALITVCPLVLAFFPYNPLRYYVPVVPAYILLILEWFHLNATREKDETFQWQWLTRFIAGVLLFLCVFSFGVMFNHLVLVHLPFHFGDEPGLSGPGMARYFTPIAVAGAIVIYMLRRYIFSGSVFSGAVLLLIAIAMVYNAVTIGKFFLKPSYQAASIQRQISRLVPAEASIAGDWAPFLAMNTSLRSIYLNTYNNQEKILAIRPSYFLHNDNHISDLNREAIINAGASLGQPLLRSHYHQAQIILYPVIYSP